MSFLDRMNLMKKPVFLVFFTLALAVFVQFAHAGQPRFLQAYGDWDTYVFTEGDGKVCYMASRPKTDEGDYTRRGEIYAYITHRPAEGTRDVFGYVAGYTYKAGSEVEVTIGGETMTLFTQEDKAWALDEDADAKIVDLIKKGSSMVVRGVSSRGTKTKDTYSLSGSTKAYQRINQECGL